MNQKMKEKYYKILCDWNGGGYTKQEVAIENNVTINYVYRILRAYKSKGWFIRKRQSNLSARDLLIVEEWNASGTSTLQSLGNKYNLTRERIRQIVDRARFNKVEVIEMKDKFNKRYEEKYRPILKTLQAYILDNYYNPDYKDWKKEQGNVVYKEIRKIEKNLIKEGLLTPVLKFKNYWEERERLYGDRYATIKKLKEEECTLDVIAKKMGLSKPRISQHIREMKILNIPYERMACPNQVLACSLPKEEMQYRIETIMSGMKQSKTSKSIAEEIGIDTHQVYRYKAKYITKEIYEDWLKKESRNER
jgi:DNA-binding CsgD family transcriptional regulator/transposase